jgi:WD40 repeat protein
MKYPVKVKHGGQVLARIYKPSKSYPLYRLAWMVTGQRRMKAFPTYSAAKKHADKLVVDLHKGSQVTALTPGQATNALASLERLQGFYRDTGNGNANISLFPDGGILLNGGSSTLARLNSDGSYDATFAPKPSFWVNAVAFQPDGKLLIAGQFSSVAGTNVNGIARLNGTSTNAAALQFLSINAYPGMLLNGTVSNNYRIE